MPQCVWAQVSEDSYSGLFENDDCLEGVHHHPILLRNLKHTHIQTDTEIRSELTLRTHTNIKKHRNLPRYFY